MGLESAIPGLGLLTGGVQAGLGVYEAINANRGLKNLQGQPMPGYSMSPEFQNYYNTAQQQAQGGFSGAETAAFKQNLAQQQNTGFQQGIQQAGGNLGQALSNGLQAQNIGAINQFAGQDAQLHRQNIAQWGQAANQMQDQQNLINQNKIQRRTQLEQAYGGALNKGLSNITSGLMGGIGLGINAYGNMDSKSNSGKYSSGISDQQYSNMVDNDINSGYFK